MINSLTPEQIAKFPEYVKRWTDIGLSTEPADRKNAKEAIQLMYEGAGLKPPKVVWCGSPFSNALTRAIVTELLKHPAGASVRASVWASVRDSVGASVWASVWASVRASVRDSVRDSVGASVRDSVYGQHDANWLAFYRYFHDECGLVTQTKKLDGLWLLCQSAGWALPHENICWVSERPLVLKKDEQGRLHCEDGPALAYPDGWCIYSWHGVRIPDWIIRTPEQITPDGIAKEQNAEVRRVMLEKFGRDRFLELPSCKLIYTDEWGSLYHNDEIRDVNGEPYCFVKVVNSTPEPDGSFKDYILRVNPNCKTAAEAVASTQPRIKDFAPIIEA